VVKIGGYSITDTPETTAMHTLTASLKSAAMLLFALCLANSSLAAERSLTLEGKDGPGKGKHIVLISGDEEYRSEEALPMLAKILSERHGFKCTVVFSVNEAGEIDPNRQDSISDSAALDSADAIIMALRFRKWSDGDMQKFVAAYERGIPVIGLRTSTHAFLSKYKGMDKFGENVLGEEWVSHWGVHKKEATRGVIEGDAKEHPVLRGVADVFGDTDVYEAYPPADAKILLRGEVLKGMSADSGRASYKKKRASDGKEQDINDPMMPVAWYRVQKAAGVASQRILCTTMGSATDLQNEGLRRLIVNSVYWGLGFEVPAKADVDYVDPYEPLMYGFNGARKGIKISDHALGKKLPDGK
jgi:hypothetical protein